LWGAGRKNVEIQKETAKSVYRGTKEKKM